MTEGKIGIKIPVPTKFSGKVQQCTTSWLDEWKIQVEDYLYLGKLTDNNEQMIFVSNCLEEGLRKFYQGYRTSNRPKKAGGTATDEGKWTFDKFFEALKETYVPINHIHDQMMKQYDIKQGTNGQSKDIKQIAINIMQLAEEIDNGKTLGWKQRIIRLLEAMRPELRIKVEPDTDLSKSVYTQSDFTKIAQFAEKNDRILHQLGAYGTTNKETLLIDTH